MMMVQQQPGMMVQQQPWMMVQQQPGMMVQQPGVVVMQQQPPPPVVINIPPGQQVTVVQGGANVTVIMLQPTQAIQVASKLERVFLGIGWRGKTDGSGGSKMVDVDASVVALSQGSPVDTISFKKLKNAGKSICHTGDVLVGAGKESAAVTDMERIYVWLSKVDATTDCLVFVANIYTAGIDFSQLDEAYVRMVNADTNQELGRMALSGDNSLNGNALAFCKLYRHQQGTWQLMGLGLPQSLPGTSKVEDMIPFLQQSGCAYTPQPVVFPQGAVTPVQPTPPPPAADGKKKKPQKPTKVMPCPGLAVASAAGIAAATAIFLAPNLDASMMESSIFECEVDFGELELPSDLDLDLGGATELLDGADFGAVFGWAEGMVDGIDLGGAGDAIAGAAANVGEAIGNVDLGEAGDAIGGAAANAGEAIGNVDLGGAGDAVSGAAAHAGEAIGNVDVSGAAAGAGDAIGGAVGSTGEAIGNADVGGMVGQAVGMVGNAAESLGGALSGAAGSVKDVVGNIDLGAVGEAAGGVMEHVGDFAKG